MAIGIVSDAEFDNELVEKPKVRVDYKKIERGRGVAKETPESIRKIISEEALKGTPAKILEGVFGVSPSSIAAYKHDATSTASYHEPDSSLKKNNDEVRLEISTKARARLMSALDHITEEKLQNAKLRDVSAVAKDMASVLNTSEPLVGTNNGIQFIFHVPETKKESDYEIIDVTN